MDTITDRLGNACGHLHAAKTQMIPSDDQIICNHVRDALVQVELAQESWREKSTLLEHFADVVKMIQDATADEFNTSAACRKIWNEAEKMRCLLPAKGAK